MCNTERCDMIYLAWHGQTIYNTQNLLNGQYDDPLTDEGKLQAEKLAEKCLGLGIEFIYSSPLIRSFITARTVADVLGVEKIVTLKNLAERDFGGMTHNPVSRICEMPDIFQANENSIYFLSGLGSETFPELIKRVRPIYESILSTHQYDEKVLIVSHGDVMKAFEALHRGVHFMEVLKEGHYNNCQIVSL